MIPASFDYHAPASLPEALALLAKYGDDAKVLSGGQSLLPLLKLRLGPAGHLVDIGRIPGLEYIREEGGMLKIGGRTRESALEHSELVKARYPILARHGEGDRRSAGAEPGHRGRQPGPRRPGQRPPGDDARPARPGGGHRAEGRADDPDRAVLHRSLPDRAQARRDPDRDPHSRAPRPLRRRLREAGAQGGRLRHRRRCGAGDAGGRRDGGEGRASASPTSARRPSAAPTPRRTSPGRNPTRRPSPRRRSWRRRRPPPRPTGAARSSTSGRWRAC